MAKNASAKPKKWSGGYIRYGKKGPTYVIEQWRGGVRFHVSTRQATERDALRELVRFNDDPVNYDAANLRAAQARRRLVLTELLVTEYRDWMMTREKPASREWALTCANFLADWTEDLDGKDLREVSVIDDLRPALDERGTSRKHRIEAIKAFCSWLRKHKGLLRHAEDPTLDLAVPQGTAEKTRRRKVVERERVLKVMPHLPADVLDILILQTGTAYHVSEVKRFAERGELIKTPGQSITLLTRHGAQEVPLLAVCVVKHKSQENVANPLIHQEHVDAAERLRAAGRIAGRHRQLDAMEAACKAADVTYFSLGVMRHSVMTWSVELGGERKKVSEFAHHRSEKTSNDFYIDLALPVETVPVIRPTLTVIDGGKKTA